MTSVTLRNGSIVPQNAYNETKQQLDALWNGSVLENGLVLMELVKKCREPKHQILSDLACDTETLLKDRKLLDKTGEPSETVRQIVLNAFVGEGLTIDFVNPLAAVKSKEGSVIPKSDFVNPLTPGKLKDGSVIPKDDYNKIIDNLKALRQESTPTSGMVLAELVRKCRDPKHQIFLDIVCDAEALLKERELLDNTGNPSETVKRIVLNAFVGEALTLNFVSPLAVSKL